MKLIYFLIIKPIETVLSLLFASYVHITGNYGFSIILLSLSVTVIMFPLFYIAEVWKRKEQATEKRMKKWLTYIKKNYSGQKRYCMTKAAHRLVGYTAASSFRTSFGLLIQIPFFFAAYHLLSHYQGFKGLGWFFIKDFAVPDGLLWGVNLLPIAMTLINVVSSSIYMKGSRAKEIVELYVMAGIFLVLLYWSPSALVLYWTMNNIFSIGKSLIFVRLFPHEKYVPDPDEKTFKESLAEWKGVIAPCFTPTFYVFIAVSALFAFQCWQIIFNKEIFEKLFLGTSAFAFAAVAISFFVWIKRFKAGKDGWIPLLKLCAFGAFYLGFSLLGFYFKQIHADGGLLRKLVLVSSIFADVLLFISVSYIFGRKAQYKPDKEYKKIYFWATSFFFGFITIISPLLVYLSSPADTGITVWTVLLNNVPVLVVFMALCILCWKLVGNKQTLAMVAVAMALVLVLYQYILPNNFGQLDRTILGQAEELKHIPALFYVFDVLILGAAWIAASVLVRKYPSVCKSCVIIVLVCLCGFTGVKCIKYAAKEKPPIADSRDLTQLPADNDAINGYSKSGKNVVLLIADMFTGGYMDQILKDCPEYREKLAGFTWYQNMLAASTETAISMPSIFAGKEYMPLAMNQMPGVGEEKVNRAGQKMFDDVKANGFAPSIVNGWASYFAPETMEGIPHADVEDYEGYWENFRKFNVKSAKTVNQPHLLSMLTIFQSAPYFLKPVVYNDGGWLIFSKIALFWYVKEHVCSEYSYLDLMSQVSNADAKQNTFKFIHSCFTHIPYGVGSNGELVDFNTEYPDQKLKSFIYGESAYNSAKKFIALFIAWTDWLKANGLYDNTYIILASDHGNDYSDNNPLTPDGIESIISREGFNRFNSLLMVKPAGAKGAFKADSTFTSGGDINAFVQDAIGNGKPEIDNDELYAVSSKADFVTSRSNFRTNEVTKYAIYKVNKNIFDPKNWEAVK